MQLTVSFKKGKKSESSVYHNNRKLEKNFDYSKKGHQHIRKEETKNNVQLINENIDDVYDLYFTDAMKKYNAKNKKKHPERCFKAKTKEEKKSLLLMCQAVHDLKKMKKPIREKYLEKIKQTSPDFYEFCVKHQDMKLSELRHLASEIKRTKTYGRVMHEKMKHDQTTVAQVEFLMQIGNAGDFNVTDDKGFFLDKNGKRILDKDGKAVSKYSSSKEIDSITPYLVRKNPELWKQANTILKKSLKDFQKRNPNFVVYNAVIHNDEASPHLHFNTVPIAKGYKRGLERRVSINKALDNEGYKISKEDNRKQFTDFQHAEANAIAQTMYAETGISRRPGETNHIKNVHEYKKVQNAISNEKVELENVQKKSATYTKTLNKQKEVYTNNKRVLDQQKENYKDIHKQAEALATWSKQKEEEKRKFEEKLEKEKADQEKALQEREKAVAEREKNVASNYNAFNKMFQQFKENYMLSGLQEMSDAELENENRFDLAYDFATTTNTKSAKQFESFVFDKHPRRKIKAFLSAITSAFGRIDSINTAVLNQKEFIYEYEKENKQQQQMQTHQSNKQQENDIDDLY